MENNTPATNENQMTSEHYASLVTVLGRHLAIKGQAQDAPKIPLDFVAEITSQKLVGQERMLFFEILMEAGRKLEKISSGLKGQRKTEIVDAVETAEEELSECDSRCGDLRGLVEDLEYQIETANEKIKEASSKLEGLTGPREIEAVISWIGQQMLATENRSYDAMKKIGDIAPDPAKPWAQNIHIGNVAKTKEEMFLADVWPL